jgi:hypothetical protein
MKALAVYFTIPLAIFVGLVMLTTARPDGIGADFTVIDFRINLEHNSGRVQIIILPTLYPSGEWIYWGSVLFREQRLYNSVKRSHKEKLIGGLPSFSFRREFFPMVSASIPNWLILLVIFGFSTAGYVHHRKRRNC